MDKKKIKNLLSRNEIPLSPLAGLAEQREWLDWMAIRKDPKIKDPWVKEITYNLNQFGYRCDEFESPKRINLFTVGSSYSFGVGIPYEYTFSYLVARMIEQDLNLPVLNWNLSSAGKSSDYCSRIVSAAIPNLTPQIAIVNFPFIARREFITEAFKIIGYTPNVPKKIIRDNMAPEAFDIYEAYNKLASLPNDISNFVLNYRLCEETLNRCGVIWCFSTLEASATEYLSNVNQIDNHIGAFLETDRKAADGMHPGPEANRFFAEAIMRHFRESGKLELLKLQLEK